MAIEKLKISKRLQANMIKLGYPVAKDFQSKAVPRIVGGHSIIGIAPSGAGKTTAYILGALSRLKPSLDEAPKILVLAPNEERVTDIVERFILLSGDKELPIMGLYENRLKEDEVDELYLGVDIVVATPSRARAIYLKLGLNLNRIETFIIDGLSEIIAQGMQTNLRELAQSCGKVQYLAFDAVLQENKRTEKFLQEIMPQADRVISQDPDLLDIQTHELIRYDLPDYNTKIKLARFLLQDAEVFEKVVIFVNSASMAEELLNALQLEKQEAAIYQPSEGSTQLAINDIEIFKQVKACRVLIIDNSRHGDINLDHVPFIFHFEVPEDPLTYIYQVQKTTEDESLVIAFVAPEELANVQRLEKAIGEAITSLALPED